MQKIGKLVIVINKIKYNNIMKNKITGRDILIILVMCVWAASIVWGILHSI